MFRKRFRSRFRSFGRRRFRPRARLAKGETQTKWNWGNFFTEGALGSYEDPVGPGQTSNLSHILARIEGHFAIDVVGGGEENSLNRAVRFLDIGGIVISCGILPDKFWDVSPAGMAGFYQGFLCTQETDNDGVPLATDYDFFRSTQPTILAQSNLNTTERLDAPNRIHWRTPCTRVDWLASAGSEGTNQLSINRQQAVFRYEWQRSMRLRLRLDSRKALTWLWFFRTAASWPGVEIVRDSYVWTAGSIFYRWVF